MNDVWKKADFKKYDAVFYVAGIAHVDPKPEMAPLYYKVNRDLTIEIAKWAKKVGVKQFVFMSPLLNVIYGLNGYLGFVLVAFMIVNDVRVWKIRKIS